MSKTSLRTRHPKDKSLSESLDEEPKKKGLIDKKTTLVKAPGDDGEVGATMQPTSDQLAKINQFTRKAVSAEEVCVLPTLSCNDIEDRDDDRFTTECVKDFAELPQPFSPVGKSFMIDHAYKVENAVGRIFEVATQKIKNALFLTNEVYIPNTEKNKTFLEDVDYGINWAVSVGVVLGKSECSVCQEGFSSWGYWCITGHDKGLYYDPKNEETDGGGWPVPVAPETSGAVKCIQEFKDPKDFYELSQVFLGAQYYAALGEKSPEVAGMLKAASAAGIPTVGLSAEEAKEIPLRHEPPKVTEARLKGEIQETESGEVKWTDDQNIVWVYDPQEPEAGVKSLGRAVTDKEQEEEDGEGQLDEHDSGNVEQGDEPESQPVEEDGDASGSGDSGSEDGSDGSSGTGEEGDPVEVSETESEDLEEEAESGEEETSGATDVSAIARKSGLPEDLVTSVIRSGTAGAETFFLACSREINSLRVEVDRLKPKAVLGDEYTKSLQAEAIDWYVKAHKEADNKPVATEMFERLLDRCGDDISLIREMIEEQKKYANAKFPAPVRRSSFPVDPHSVNGSPKRPHIVTDSGGEENEDEDRSADTRASRRHG